MTNKVVLGDETTVVARLIQASFQVMSLWWEQGPRTPSLCHWHRCQWRRAVFRRGGAKAFHTLAHKVLGTTTHSVPSFASCHLLPLLSCILLGVLESSHTKQGPVLCTWLWWGTDGLHSASHKNDVALSQAHNGGRSICTSHSFVWAAVIQHRRVACGPLGSFKLIPFPTL